MAVKLVESALPRSGSGRKAADLSQELVEALSGALAESSTIEANGETRPRALGIEDGYETSGKAGSAGRRYADAIAEKLTVDPAKPVRVRVNVYGTTRNEKKEWVGPFHWRVYIPLAES